MQAEIGIIGGADGPTAVLVAGELLPLIIGGAALVIFAALIITAIAVARKK